jgi:hypothetical protein
MEQFDYSEMVYGFLSLSPKNSDFGPCVRSYRIDYRHDAFYFFAKCPEEVLDVEVFSILGGEMHQADSTSFTPRRFLYVEKKESAAELNALMKIKGFEKQDDFYESRYLMAFPHQNGLVYTVKNCRKSFGEAPDRQR